MRVVARQIRFLANSCAARSLREAYDTLQVETQRLFQLAMSEVAAAPASKEKLQRRYEELRSASQVSEGQRSSEGGVVNDRDSVHDKHTVRSGKSKSFAAFPFPLSFSLFCLFQIRIDGSCVFVR